MLDVALGSSSELPPKSREEANADFLANRTPAVRNKGPYTPPLDQIRVTPLCLSPVGLVNAHLWGYDIPEKIHTSFAVDPDRNRLQNHKFWFSSTTNSASEKKLVRPPREGETYLEMMQEFFNTATWLTSPDALGRQAEAIVVIELNYKHRPERICTVVRDLYSFGFRHQTYGNEFDLPWAHEWRNRPGLQEDALRDANACRAQEALPGVKFSPAGPAYYDYPGLRQEVALMGIPADHFDFITLHLYPPVNDIEAVRDYKRETKPVLGISALIDQTYQVMQRNGWEGKELILREVGFPGADHPQTQFRLDQLAECHLPAMLMLAIGSKKVSKVFWYNFHSMGQDYQSLASFKDGKWVLKPTFDAWEYNARLLAQLEDITILSSKDYTLVKLKRTDGIEAVVGWANGTKRMILERPEGVIVTDAYGIQRFESNFILEPSPASPVLTGSARYMVRRGHLDIPVRIA